MGLRSGVVLGRVLVTDSRSNRGAGKMEEQGVFSAYRVIK